MTYLFLKFLHLIGAFVILGTGSGATTSLLDIAVGACIGVRRTCWLGLLAGCGVSLAYLVGATFLTPALWTDPLGPLVKIFPQLALMIVALAVLGDR
jgi:hypothetical protein